MGKTIVSETRITTPIFRLAFPSVYEASQVNGQGAFKFRITMLFEKSLWDTELLPLRQIVRELIEKKYGVGTQPPANFYLPYKDGDGKVSKKTGKAYEGYEGTKVIGAQSDYLRPVVDGGNAAKKIKPQEVIDTKEIYAGCYCKASVNAYLWDNMGQGVSIGYLALQKVKDGKPFSNFADAAADFAPITPELVDGNKEKLFGQAGAVEGAIPPSTNNLMNQL